MNTKVLFQYNIQKCAGRERLKNISCDVLSQAWLTSINLRFDLCN